jgi:pimeloyl-ACP methyl ester carboxylesterase
MRVSGRLRLLGFLLVIGIAGAALWSRQSVQVTSAPLVAAGTPTPAPASTGPALPPPIGTSAYGVLRDPAFEALPGATARYGVYDGGVYRMEVPANWNGGLVMYAHGYRGEGPDIYVGNSLIRSHLIANGYAWAASSYRGNSYRPDWGVDDTLLLREMFIKQFGQPRWTIIEGTSMGGHVTIASLEQHPGIYQAALSECGVMTGIGVIDYLRAYTAVADYISGVRLLDAPTIAAFIGLVTNEWLPAMGRPGAYTEKGRQFDSVVKYLMGGDLPLRSEGLAARYTANLLPVEDAESSTSPFGRARSTRQIRYRIDPGFGITEEELNTNVRRLDHATGSRSYEENPVFADFTGTISVPVLSLHTTGDAFVPFSLEQEYRRKVIAAGTDDLLVQRGIRRPMHCQFEDAELNRAFDDLIAWLERGVKPEGDDVLASDLSGIGLRWTMPLLPQDPANRR